MIVGKKDYYEALGKIFSNKGKGLSFGFPDTKEMVLNIRYFSDVKTW